MPGVVVAAPLRLAGPHRKHRLAAIQRLDLRLLIDAQHQGVLGWGHIQPDDVAHLGDKIRIGGQLERLLPGAASGQRRAGFRCTVLTERPLSCAMPRELQCVASSGWLSSVRVITASMRSSSIVRGAPWSRSIAQSLDPLVKEAAAPLADRHGMHTKLMADHLVLQPIGTGQDNTRALGKVFQPSLAAPPTPSVQSAQPPSASALPAVVPP